MKKSHKITYVIALLLMFGILLVGYAAIADNMLISGTVEMTGKMVGIFITDLSVYSTTGGVTDTGSRYITPTNVESVVNVGGAGSITYKVTVENNTDGTYWYRGTVIVPTLEGYQNGSVGSGITVTTKDKPDDASQTFDTDDWVPPHTVREFYVIYTFNSSVKGTAKTFVNYEFGARIVSYADEFLAILNTPERYATLAEKFDRAYASNGTDVLGNTGADLEFFDDLFISGMELNGEPVNIMIQRKNVDGKTTGDSYSPSGPSGCEYTVYITTEDPTTGTPTVYAVSYTTNSDGSWRQIGELYEGTASIGTYVDSEGKTTPYFNVNTWTAKQHTYTVFSYGGRVVEYTVNNRYGNSFQQQKTISELMTMEDIEMYNRLDDHPIFKAVYKALQDHQGSEATEVVLLREAYAEAIKYFNVYNNGQEFKVIRNKYTRAEIIASLENLAHAMEYYEQTHITTHNQ